MHIAWLGKKSPFCGNVTYSRKITNALSERGYRVSFLHFARRGEAPEGEASEVLLPFLHKSQGYTLPLPTAYPVLQRSLQRLQPDLVHASLTLSPLDFCLPQMCRELGLPLVATFHPGFDRYLRSWRSGAQYLAYQLYAPFLAEYDCAIVFSDLQRNLLQRVGVPREKIAVIPNGVDEEQYSPGASNFKSYFQADRLFVYQGRISAEKNVAGLLQAWKICDLGAGCKLAIVGDGPLRRSLQASYGEKDGVIWLGFVPDEDKRIEILRAADVFILPSFVEGLSLSLLEAMACGIACVGTDAGADGEVLQGGAGIAIGTRRATSQLSALLPTLRDRPELTARLGQKARQRVLERYTLRKNISHLEALYAKLVAAPRTKSQKVCYSEKREASGHRQ